jgi:hypothetical protein
MAVFGIPVWIGDRTAIHERTAQPFPAREMIEPTIKLGMVGVVGEHGSAEQQQDQSQSLHRRTPSFGYRPAIPDAFCLLKFSAYDETTDSIWCRKDRSLCCADAGSARAITMIGTI